MCEQFPTGNENRIKIQTVNQDFDERLQEASHDMCFEITQTCHPQWANYPIKANFVLNTNVKFSATSQEQAMLTIHNEPEPSATEEQVAPIEKLQHKQPA